MTDNLWFIKLVSHLYYLDNPQEKLGGLMLSYFPLDLAEYCMPNGAKSSSPYCLHAFFDLPGRWQPITFTPVALPSASPSPLFYACPNHLNLCTLDSVFSFLTLHFLYNSSLYTPSLHVILAIYLNIF